jgi:hypothetical protein
MLGNGDKVYGHGATIHLGNYYFCDPSLTGQICDTAFAVGEEVDWEVLDGFHTITGCDESFTVCPPPTGGFELGIASPGELKLYVFGTPGIYEYRCNYHPTQMRGRIFVGVETPAPTPTPVPPGAPAPTGVFPTTTPNTTMPTVNPSIVAGASIGPQALAAGGGAPAIERASVWILASLSLGGTVTMATLALLVRRRLR